MISAASSASRGRQRKGFAVRTSRPTWRPRRTTGGHGTGSSVGRGLATVTRRLPMALAAFFFSTSLFDLERWHAAGMSFASSRRSSKPRDDRVPAPWVEGQIASERPIRRERRRVDVYAVGMVPCRLARLSCRARRRPTRAVACPPAGGARSGIRARLRWRTPDGKPRTAPHLGVFEVVVVLERGGQVLVLGGPLRQISTQLLLRACVVDDQELSFGAHRPEGGDGVAEEDGQPVPDDHRGGPRARRSPRGT